MGRGSVRRCVFGAALASGLCSYGCKTGDTVIEGTLRVRDSRGVDRIVASGETGSYLGLNGPDGRKVMTLEVAPPSSPTVPLGPLRGPEGWGGRLRIFDDLGNTRVEVSFFDGISQIRIDRGNGSQAVVFLVDRQGNLVSPAVLPH